MHTTEPKDTKINSNIVDSKTLRGMPLIRKPYQRLLTYVTERSSTSNSSFIEELSLLLVGFLSLRFLSLCDAEKEVVLCSDIGVRLFWSDTRWEPLQLS